MCCVANRRRPIAAPPGASAIETVPSNVYDTARVSEDCTVKRITRETSWGAWLRFSWI